MQQNDDKALIPVPIASQAASGNVATIPTAQATAGDGRVSIDLGYPPECAISVAAGGKYPEMQDANGVYKLLSSAIRSIQAWGILPFNATFATAIGGYPKYAVCVDSAGAYWVSTADSNTTVPGAGGANWQSLFNGYATEAWADGRYLQNYADGEDEVIKRMAFRPSAGAPFIDGFADGPFFFQRQGDYATNTALTQGLAGKANLIGGNNLSGNQNISEGNITLVGDTATQNTSQQLIIQCGDSWRYAFDYVHDTTLGNYSRQIFYDGNTQNVKDILYYFLDRGRLSSAQHGDYALVSDFGVSLASNGYQKFPGGLIVQWGTVSISNGTFNFPITFPNACFFVLPGNTNAQGTAVDNAYAYALNTSEFFAATKESQGSNVISNFALAWIAFGY